MGPKVRPRIVVAGSLNMDFVVSADRMPQLGETLTGTDFHTVPGGKGANQAAGCSKLGAETYMIGSVGGDVFGKQLVENLRDFGVDTSHVRADPRRPTGTATIFHIEDDNCIVVVPGANGAVDPRMIEEGETLIRSADVLLVQLEIPLDAVRRALELAKSAGVRTVLNPAPAVPLGEELLRHVDLITPNETEFELLSGTKPRTDEELETAIRSWQERTGTTVVMTRGEIGSSYLEGGRLVTVPAPHVEVVDTTGAGDAFNAALSFKLGQGAGLGEAVRFAGKAASLSVTKFGAQGGLATEKEVNEFAK